MGDWILPLDEGWIDRHESAEFCEPLGDYTAERLHLLIAQMVKHADAHDEVEGPIDLAFKALEIAAQERAGLPMLLAGGRNMLGIETDARVDDIPQR